MFIPPLSPLPPLPTPSSEAINGGGYDASGGGASGGRGGQTYASPSHASPQLRVFVDWAVYKTRGAMTVRFIPPSWGEYRSASGAANPDLGTAFTVTR